MGIGEHPADARQFAESEIRFRQRAHQSLIIGDRRRQCVGRESQVPMNGRLEPARSVLCEFLGAQSKILVRDEVIQGFFNNRMCY